MNITEFANLLGTSKQVISRYERGENTPKITTVVHYAKVLNVPLAYLVNDNVTNKNGDLNEENAPTEPKLNESEKMLLDLFRLVPEDKQQTVLELVRLALKTQQ